MPREFGLIFFSQGDFAAAHHVVEDEDPVTVNRLDFGDIEWQERDNFVRPETMRFGFAGRESEAATTGTRQVPGPRPGPALADR